MENVERYENCPTGKSQDLEQKENSYEFGRGPTAQA
jgi:hypothetical protein